MKVLNIHEVNDVRLDDYELPERGPKDVVVKMKAVGICGSDLSYIKWGGIMRQPGGVTPIGHEGAGEVLHVGRAVEGIKPGDAVIINPMNTPSNVGSGGPEGAFVNELLVRDPALLSASVRPFADYPGGHNEGFPDTFKQLFRAIYATIDHGAESRFPTFADGHREILLCEAILRSHQSRSWCPVASGSQERTGLCS